MSRRTVAIIVVVAVAFSSLVTWIARDHIRSPEEIAARTAPPVASRLLVPVERRVLTTKIVSRGTGRFGSARELGITPSRLKESSRVITTVPSPGQVIKEGEPLLTISSRPVFLLKGSRPTFRDIGPGLSGEDVRQLEDALQRQGFRPGAVDGKYDASTGDAVARFYRAHGFEPIVASDQQLAAALPKDASLVAGGRQSAGVQVPADEVIFGPDVPVRIAKVAAPAGAAPEGNVLTVTDSAVAIDGSLRLEEAPLVKTGMAVDIDEPDLGITAKGTVTRVAQQPGTDGADGFHVYFEVAVPQPPPALVGASVRMTIPVKSTSNEVIAVPISAVSLGPDGASRVQRAVGSQFEFVTVKPGLSAEGFVEINSASTELKPGDMVVVGSKRGKTTRP